MNRLFGARAAAFCLAGALATFVTSAAPETFAQSSRSGGARAKQQQQQQRPATPGLDLKRGAAEAPAAVQAAGVACTVTEAAYVGSTADKRNAYEVACREGLGYLITSAPPAGGTAAVFDCLAAQTSAKLAEAKGQTGAPVCRLPGNAQPARGLQPLVTAAGLQCTVSNARYLGESTATKSRKYEIACSEGPGYLLDRPTGGAQPTAMNCLRAEAGGFRCELTTKAQNLTLASQLASQSGRTCTVSDARLVGTNPQNNNEVYEIGCSNGPGFLVEASAGRFSRALDCGRFGSVQCQFTAQTQVQERNAQDYARLLRASNFDCAVSNFARLGTEQGTGREIVEVACSNRPDGAIALLSDTAGRSEVYDCLLAQRRKLQCKLTSEEALYPKLSAGVTAAQKANCTVTTTRRMGTATTGEDWFEVSCAQGRNAVLSYAGNGQVREVVRCSQASGVLGGCKLPVAEPAGRR